MENNSQFKETPMQALRDSIIMTKRVLSNSGEYSDVDFMVHLDFVCNLLDNYFSIEELRLSQAFDYGFLQGQLNERAEVVDGVDYVKKNFKKEFKKNENISSTV